MVALQNLQIVQNQTGTSGEFLVDRKVPYVHLAIIKMVRGYKFVNFISAFSARKKGLLENYN